MFKHKPSQFHKDEIAIQSKLGVADMVARYSEGFIRPAMPEQHREFFTQLPFMILGVVDSDDQVWAMPVYGEPGFITTPDSQTLSFSSRPKLVEKLDLKFNSGSDIGMLGIQLETRRRNRVNGVITKVSENSFEVAVKQSFGNCPQYIQVRSMTWNKNAAALSSSGNNDVDVNLSERSIDLISQSDTFFITSRTKEFTGDPRTGIDASHRGGKPGFVTVEGDFILFPDFSGNRFFNTLGNIHSDGRVGLFFPDFVSGNAVFVTGSADIIWDPEVFKQVDGAERVIKVKVHKSLYLTNFLELTGNVQQVSPSLRGTGIWPTKIRTDK